MAGQVSLAGNSPVPATHLPSVLLFSDHALETAELKDVEILSAGTWTTMTGQRVTFTQADLAILAANFQTLSDRVKPPLKLGHEADDKQALLTGAPALGWMENVRAIGGKLIADFKAVPKKFYQLVEAGAYRRISAEIARGWTDSVTGKTYDMVIKAAGVLGASAPAISNLKDLMNLYGLPGSGELISSEVIALSDPIAQGGNKMLTEAQLTALTGRIDALEASNKANQQFSENVCKALGIEATADPIAAIATLKKKAVDSADVLAQVADEKFAEEVDEIITKAKKDGKLLPAAEQAVRLMVRGWAREADENEGVLSFTTTDTKTKKEKKINGSVTECLAEYFSAQAQVLRIGTEFGSGRVSRDPKDAVKQLPRDVVEFATSGHRPTAIDARSMDRDAEVRAYMKENDITDYFAGFTAYHGMLNNAINE